MSADEIADAREDLRRLEAMRAYGAEHGASTAPVDAMIDAQRRLIEGLETGDDDAVAAALADAKRAGDDVRALRDEHEPGTENEGENA